MSGPAEQRGSGTRVPLHFFWKKYVKEKKKERETEKREKERMSYLPVSQMRYRNMLI